MNSSDGLFANSWKQGGSRHRQVIPFFGGIASGLVWLNAWLKRVNEMVSMVKELFIPA